MERDYYIVDSRGILSEIMMGHGYTIFLVMYFTKAFWNLNLSFSMIQKQFFIRLSFALIITKLWGQIISYMESFWQNMFSLMDNFMSHCQKNLLKYWPKVLSTSMKGIYAILFIRRSPLTKYDVHPHVLYCCYIFYIYLLLIHFLQEYIPFLEVFFLNNF